MDKPFSAKAFYSEVEALYRSRVSSFLPLVNSLINPLGLEVGGVQLNDSCFIGKEFFLNPKEVNPERGTFEDLNSSEDFLRFLKGLYPESYKESKSEVVKQLTEALGSLGIDELHDYTYREDHAFSNQVFIRPRGSDLKISDIDIIGHLYQNLGSTFAYRGGTGGWDEGVLDDFNFVIAGPKGGFSENEVSLSASSYDYSFYRFVSKTVSIILTLPLLEVLLESGVVKSSRESSLIPSLGRVAAEKNIYSEANAVLALPKEYLASPNSDDVLSVTEEDIEGFISSLASIKFQVSNQIVNPRVKEIFLEEVKYLISEAIELLAKYWEKGVENLNLKGIEVSPGTDSVVADSPESLKPVLDRVFDSVKRSYEYLYSGGYYEPEDRTKPFTPMFSFVVPKGGWSREKLSKLPLVAGDSTFSRILSSVPEVLVVESTSIRRENRFGEKAVKATSEVYLYPVGPRGKLGKRVREIPDVSGGSSVYDLVLLGDWVRGRENVAKLLSPSMDPVYSLHAYLFPLIPALFYYGYASHLVLDPSSLKQGGTVWVESRISQELGGEGGEGDGVEEGFFSSFSERVLGTLNRLFKEVWEGTLEKEHEEYLKRAKAFLKSLSPSEDRIFCTVTSGYGPDLNASINVAVKFRPDEDFVSSLGGLLLSAVSLLQEIGDRVDVRLIFL